MFIIKSNLRSLLFKNKLFIRGKHKDTHWSVLKKKVHSVDKALNHFDDFYKDVYKHSWPSIRQALLNKQKYIAVVNNYGDIEETVASLELLGALNVRTLFNLEKSYINERYAKNKRTRQLEKIWEMDKQMEIDETNIIKDVVQETKPNYSLEASLNTAEYDVDRLISGNENFSSVVLGQFVPATKIKGKEDWVPESQYYRYYDKNSNVDVHIENEHDIHFPEHLNVYCYEEENFSSYPPPKRTVTGVFNYYLMDGGSLLPVLALDIKPGHRILDMCAAPGGKSLLAIQTLYPDFILCNDISWSRRNRIYSVFDQYLYDLGERWIKANRLKITHGNGTLIQGSFDRILVDVPCTTDRISVTNNDNNIFKSNRIKERLQLPEIQCQLLVHALKLVALGGVVVYSTCTLSPIQNDGVVHMALKQISQETKIKIIVKNLSAALVQTKTVYKLASPNLMRYGSLVVPSCGQNYGPTYFCKLQRIK